MRILIVDDDSLVRGATVLRLSGLGHSVAQADSADDGLALYERSKFDLVITDGSMPKKDGLAFTQDLMARDPKAVVIMFSGSPDMEAPFMRAGGLLFIDKLDARKLIAAVEQVKP